MNDFSRKQLLINYLLGICTEWEKEEVERWLDKDPDNLALLQKTARELGREKQFPLPDKARMKEDILQQVGKSASSVEAKPKSDQSGHPLKLRQSRISWFLRVAAVFMIVGFTALFGILWLGDFQEDESSVMKEVITNRGERAQITLKDGTRVRLNADSKITYPEEFGLDSRAVHLSGEAYFEVVRDGRPFYVYAGETITQVLGTEFNVKAYEEEELRIVVSEGKVVVRRHESPEVEEALLEKGDMASLQRNGKSVLSVARNVDLQPHIGWLDYRLEFDSTALAEVSAILDRWYGVDITFTDPGLAELRYTAVFEDESIEEILQAINLSAGLEYTMQDRKITFFRKKEEGSK